MLPLDGSDLRSAVRTTLRQWHQVSPECSTLAHLHLHSRLMRETEYTPHQADRALVRDALDRLQAEHSADAELLELRYLDNHTVTQMAHRRNVAESTIYVQQREAIGRLATVIAAQERELVAEKQAALDERLGAPVYGEAIGLDEAVRALAPSLTSLEPPWLLVVEGIGGIGKTTLAHVLTRRLALHPRFAGIAWVSAQPHQLLLDGSLRTRAGAATSAEAVMAGLVRQIIPEEAALYLAQPANARAALRRRLAAQPHLIVVDNLETVDDLEVLVPLLADLADPSKILLTSRQRYVGEHTLTHFRVPEMSEAYALALIRQEANRLALGPLQSAGDRELRPIYAAVGGNPLALQLVVGQFYHYSLPEILDNLRHARSQGVENLYTFIYRQAWQALSELERRVLLAMPLTPVEGEDAGFICAVSGLAMDEFRDGIAALVQRNLVGVGGDLQRRCYCIHSLTRTFLHEQVAKWL